MKKHLIISAALSAAFLVPAFASAAGISVGNAAINRSTVDTYSNFTIIDTNHPVSGSGWLSTFSYYPSNTNTFEFVLVDSANVVKWISPTVTPAVANVVQVLNATVPVQSGWNLGVHFDSTGTIPFDWNGAPASYTPNNNGMPVVGTTLANEGVSGRTYSWNANGSDAATCSTLTLRSTTDTQFRGLTETDPGTSSTVSSFPFGTPGSAVVADSTGFPGAWSAAIGGASWINNTAIAPTFGGTDPGQNGTINAWRLFSQSFTIPALATVQATTLHFAADNSVNAFLDNTSVGFTSSFSSVTDANLGVLAIGAHELEFVVKNDAFTGDFNPTGLLYGADVNYCVPATPQVTECPAAPSIAAAYLHSKNIKPNTTSYKNIISKVAKTMSPQTDFIGTNSCNIAYPNTVQTFVDGLLL